MLRKADVRSSCAGMQAARKSWDSPNPAAAINAASKGRQKPARRRRRETRLGRRGDAEPPAPRAGAVPEASARDRGDALVAQLQAALEVDSEARVPGTPAAVVVPGEATTVAEALEGESKSARQRVTAYLRPYDTRALKEPVGDLQASLLEFVHSLEGEAGSVRRVMRFA